MAPHRIIALWAHPRSMSTATERVMRERGDLDCAHEPFMYDYYVHRQAGRMPHFDVQADHPVTYAAIRDMLMARAEVGHLFFKDMAYYVTPYLLDDPEFHEALEHVFLIRNPQAALASYHRLDPDFTCEEAGIAAQWTLYDGLRQRGVSPVVIRAEDIRNAPGAMMRALWDQVGLPDAPHALDWTGDVPQDWAQVGTWHGEASATDGIRPMDAGYEERAREKFETAATQTPHLRDYLAYHQPFYQRLSEQALTAE